MPEAGPLRAQPHTARLWVHGEGWEHLCSINNSSWSPSAAPRLCSASGSSSSAQGTDSSWGWGLQGQGGQQGLSIPACSSLAGLPAGTSHPLQGPQTLQTLCRNHLNPSPSLCKWLRAFLMFPLEMCGTLGSRCEPGVPPGRKVGQSRRTNSSHTASDP